VGAVPGGSAYNALVSLGRVGVPGIFISETGADRVGEMIVSFLEENGIDGSGVRMFKGVKSPLSLAFLNERNDAEYVFYKDHPNDKLEMTMPEISPDDIVLISSFYAVNPVIRPQMKRVLDHAQQSGAIIYYDVNFRPSHRDEVDELLPNILDNFAYADIVRGSDEDFQVMFSKGDSRQVYKENIMPRCDTFIYTRGAQPIDIFTADGKCRSYEVPSIEGEIVSTIGAGDNFNAGFVYGLIREGITRDMLRQGVNDSQMQHIVDYAMVFSGDCCRSVQNYINAERLKLSVKR
jgi:fructokinase